MRRGIIVVLLLGALVPLTPAAAEGGIVIEEILVSASSAAYNGTDWNGDGVIGSTSDQYIQIRNTGSIDVDISCLLYTSPSPRDATLSRMPSSA